MSRLAVASLLLVAQVVWLGAAVAQGQETPTGPATTEQDLGSAQRLRDQALAFIDSGHADESADAFLAAAELFGKAGDDLERTKCLHNGGAMLDVAGRYEEAVEAFLQAQTWSARLRKADYAASSALGRGMALGRLDRQAEAVDALDIAVAIFEQLGDQGQLALALYNRGASQATLDRHEDAIEGLQRAEAIYQELGDTLGSSWATSSLALCFESAERPTKAYAAFGRAIDATRQLGDTAELGMLYNERGIVLNQLNRWDDALADFDAAEPLLAAAGDRHQLIRQAIYRGNSLTSLSRYDEALAAYELADARNPSDDDLLAGYVLQGRGDLLSHVGKFSDALELYDEVAVIMARHGEHRHLGRIATRQGESARSLGQFGEALRHLVAAEAHFRRDGNTGYTAGAILDRAELYAELGRIDESMAAYDESKALFELVDDREWLALLDVSRATALRKAGKPAEALAALERARPTLESIGNARQLVALRFDRAVLLNDRGRADDALAELDAIEESFVAMRGQEAAAQIALARASAHRRLGRTEEALAGYDRHEAILEELGLRQHLVRVAVHRGSLLAENGRHAEALASYDAAAVRLEDLLAGHIATLGESSSSTMRAEFAPVVPAMLDSVAALSDPEAASADDALARAWRVLEVFQGLGMAQLVAEQGGAGDNDLPLDLAIALEAARRDVSGAAERLVQLQETGDTEAPAAVEAMAAARADLDARRRTLGQRQDEARLASPLDVLPPVAPLDQIIAALGPDEALTHFSALGDRVFAILVTRSGPRLVALGPTARVDAAVEAVARRLDPRMRREQPVPAELIADLRALGRLVLDPILETLAAQGERPRTWLVVPSGSLCRVPFEALLTADVEMDAPSATWPFLVSDVAVAYVHSGTTWLTLKRRAERPRPRTGDSPQYVALAHPVYEPSDAPGGGASMLFMDALRGGRSWTPLPRTADEVLAVARLLAKSAEDQETLDQLADDLLMGSTGDMGPVENMGPVEGDDFLLLLREQATEQRLRTRPEVRAARILHLACHGAADIRSPALSRLVLGRSATQDGRLFVDELARLQLSCELLVLSACETNAGPIRALEGVDGLSRAGLAAGAQAVLSTLWQVQDEGARRLIVAFHADWLGAGSSRITALAHAKRQAIASGVPVSTWAAFQLWDGDTGD